MTISYLTLFSNRYDYILGHNALHGTIPGFFRVQTQTTSPECNMFGGPMKKLGLTWLTQALHITDVESLVELRTLSLRKYCSCLFIVLCEENAHYMYILCFMLIFHGDVVVIYCR